MRPRLVLLAAGACLLIGESGCAWLHGLVSAPRQAPQPPRTASAVSSDLELIGRLAGESPARQAAQLAKAKTETARAPTAANRLRYALLLATPGHGGADPVAAERQLSEIVTSADTLNPDERLLADVLLRQVTEQLALRAENRRLRDQAHARQDSADATAKRHLAAAAAENARLRKALDDAQAKLEAVTHIERSLGDRAANGPPPR